MTEQNETTDAQAIAGASEQTSRVPVLYYACDKSEENGPWEVHADQSCLAASIGFRTGMANVERREVPVMVLLLGLIKDDMEREPYALLRICRCVKELF